MTSQKKISLGLIWLVGLASCQPAIFEYEPESSGYGEEHVEDGESHYQKRAPGHHGEATGQHGVSPSDYDLERQATLGNLANAFTSMVMSFVRPLLTNLGIGTSNAILATMLRKRLALIPESHKPIAPGASARSTVPSPTVRAL